MLFSSWVIIRQLTTLSILQNTRTTSIGIIGPFRIWSKIPFQTAFKMSYIIVRRTYHHLRNSKEQSCKLIIITGKEFKMIRTSHRQLVSFSITYQNYQNQSLSKLLVSRRKHSAFHLPSEPRLASYCKNLPPIIS